MIARPVLYAGALGLGALVLYLAVKKRPETSYAASAGFAAAEAVGDVAVGAVKGVGSFFGIPDTSMTQCQKDQAAGDTWAASFSCPAGTFIRGIFNSTSITAAAASDARQIDRIIEREQASYFEPTIESMAMDAQYGA